MCADNECRVRTDLCGSIVRDDKTIEEFAKYQHHHAALIQGGGFATTSISGGTVPFGSGIGTTGGAFGGGAFGGGGFGGGGFPLGSNAAPVADPLNGGGTAAVGLF